MEIRHDEGIANQIGPEPCAIIRDDDGEESVGEITSQPLSRVRIEFGRRRCCEGASQNVGSRAKHDVATSAAARIPNDLRFIAVLTEGQSQDRRIDRPRIAFDAH